MAGDSYHHGALHEAILEAAIGVVFHEAVRRMVGAFHKRAHQVYGNASQG